jgi:hypothetical protein
MFRYAWGTYVPLLLLCDVNYIVLQNDCIIHQHNIFLKKSKQYRRIITCLLALVSQHISTTLDHHFGMGWELVQFVCQPLFGLFYQFLMFMNVEQSMEWSVGETEVLGENLPQCRFVNHKSHMIWPGPRTWTAAVGIWRLTTWGTARPRWNVGDRECVLNCFTSTYFYCLMHHLMIIRSGQTCSITSASKEMIIRQYWLVY